MIIIPGERNRVGLSATTDAKLQAADFSGSGLEALGHGLEELGQAGGKFADALDDRAARKAQSERTQSLKDDAQAKQAYVAQSQITREVLHSPEGGYLNQEGIAAIKGAQPAIKQLESLPAKLVDQIPDAGFAAHTSAMLSRRTVFDIARIRAHALAETGRWQRQQAEGILDTARADALDTLGTPLSAKHVATGLSAIETQAMIDSWSPEARKIRETGFVSLVHADAIDQQMVADPVGARAYYELHKDAMNEADRAGAERSLHLPVLEREGAALVDGYAGASSATAPQAAVPAGSAVSVADRMTAITMRREAGPSAATASAPVSGEQSAGDGTGSTQAPAPDATPVAPTPPADRTAVGGSLAGMMERYGGDPAKAWAAYKLGPERVDAVLATHGDAWFGEVPADVRDYVANNVAMLGGGSGYVPKREELGAIHAYVEQQDLPPEVKQAAMMDAEARVVRGERVIKMKQDDATNAAYAAVDELGGDFTSITQIHPAIQRDLPPETLAALTRQARQNALFETVTENGEGIADLNQLAATDPAAFLTKDLRLVRDTMTPGEYAGLAKLQEALRADPASPDVIAHRRIWDWISREGAAAGMDPKDPATRRRAQAIFARTQVDLAADTQGKRVPTDDEVMASYERAGANERAASPENAGVDGDEVIVVADRRVADDVASLSEHELAAIHAHAKTMGWNDAQESRAIQDYKDWRSRNPVTEYAVGRPAVDNDSSGGIRSGEQGTFAEAEGSARSSGVDSRRMAPAVFTKSVADNEQDDTAPAVGVMDAAYRPDSDAPLASQLIGASGGKLGDRWRKLSPNDRAKDPALANAARATNAIVKLLRNRDKTLFNQLETTNAPGGPYVTNQIINALINKIIPDELSAQGTDFSYVSDEDLGPGGKRQAYLLKRLQAAAQIALNARQQIAYNYFTSPKGGDWTPERAVGIICNLTEEGNLDPEKREQKNGRLGPGYGIVQWTTKSRKAQFQKITGVPLVGSTFEQQLFFVNWELHNGEYKTAGDKLRNADTAVEASIAVTKFYEKPDNADFKATERAKNAQAIFDSLVTVRKKSAFRK